MHAEVRQSIVSTVGRNDIAAFEFTLEGDAGNTEEQQEVSEGRQSSFANEVTMTLVPVHDSQASDTA